MSDNGTQSEGLQPLNASPKSRRWLVLGLCLAGLVLVVGGAVVVAKEREQARQELCKKRFNALTTCLMMYITDYDECLPPAENWTALLEIYKPNFEEKHRENTHYIGKPSSHPKKFLKHIMQCPEDDSGVACSYAMNPAVGGKYLSEFTAHPKTVFIFETSKPGKCPVGGRELVAQPFRHPDGNMYLFMDFSQKFKKEPQDFGP